MSVQKKSLLHQLDIENSKKDTKDKIQIIMDIPNDDVMDLGRLHHLFVLHEQFTPHWILEIYSSSILL